jgi:DNA-binding GntR family transcriptional regulator
MSIALPDDGPIRRTQLHDEVLRTLGGRILRGELAPGSRVDERALCEQLGISRTPLREALKVLAARGLVELRPNRGAWIAPLRAAEVADAFDVLALLERRAGELAGARLNDATVRTLTRLHRRLIGYSRLPDGEALLRTDLEIHRTIVKIAGNPTLASVHEGLAIKVERARYLAAISPERVRTSMREHEAIQKAIVARDAARIAEALHVHCLRTRDAVVAAVMAGAAEESAPEAA